MTGEIEEVHLAFPYRLALECFTVRHGLSERRAMRRFTGLTNAFSKKIENL
jgi:hypothetical protein